MNAELKELNDSILGAVNLMRENADQMTEQKERLGSVESLLKEKDDKLQGRINALEAELKRVETTHARTPNGTEEGTKSDPYHAAFLKFVRKGDNALTPEERTTLEQKALSVNSDPDGGYFVSPAMSARVSTVLFETSPVRQVSTVETISTDSLEGFYDGDEASASWVSEEGTRSETDTPEIGKWYIPTHEIYAEPRATQKVLDDAARDLEAWLSSKVADKFARTENAAFVNGTGVGRPRGFLTYGAGTTRGTIEQIVTGAAANFTADGIIDLVYSLKSGYRQGAVHVMNRASVSEVRKLKGSDNNYLWQPGLAGGQPSTLLSYPIVEMEDMPDVGANALAAAFGNFRIAYTIVDRQGVRVLRDPYTAKPYVKLYTTKRVGGDVINFEALKIAKCATS